MELFCYSVGNIPDGVMRAAERQSHMGSMKVSLSTRVSVIAVVKLASMLPLHSVWVLRGYNLKWKSTLHFSVELNSFELPSVSLETSVKWNEKWSKVWNWLVPQYCLMCHLVSTCPARISVWTLATVQKSQCILAAVCSLLLSSWPHCGLRTRRLS